jgi:uncharacterized protein (DUF1330 family)
MRTISLSWQTSSKMTGVRGLSKHPGISPRGEPENFEEYLLRVNPSSASLNSLAEQPDGGPVIMLNLLRFNPRGDAGIYGEYAKRAAPEVEKVGSFVGYYGRALTDFDPAFGFDDSWDGVGLVVYHRRQSFIQLQNSRNYQLAIPFRTAGASRRTLYALRDDEQLPGAATTIGELDVSRESLDSGDGDGDGNVHVLDLLSFAEDGRSKALESYIQAISPLLQQSGAVLELSVSPETPVLSEAIWDYCMLTRFPSLESVVALYGNSAWKAVQNACTETVVSRLSVASQSVPIPTTTPR